MDKAKLLYYVGFPLAVLAVSYHRFWKKNVVLHKPTRQIVSGAPQVKISNEGLDIIKEHEGWSAQPYRDPTGHWTIGFGHLIKPGDPYHPRGNVKWISKEEGERLLVQDVATAENCIADTVNVTLNQSQFDALVSFIYNLGCNAFRRSTMRELINKGEFQKAANEFPRWVYSNGERLAGLENRRAMERQLFLA